MNSLFSKLENFCKVLEPTSISETRKQILNPVVEAIQLKVIKKEAIRLNFICTHNSRRSHFTQIWAQTLAYYFNIEKVNCYSSGTEATALFPSVIKTLQQTGFQIATLSETKNPVYSIKFAQNEPPIIGFSKTIDNTFNPKTNFIAVMTCSQADEGCPFIPGAERRFSLPFEDPKTHDNTPHAEESYQQTSLQIATELHYIFSNIKA